MGKDKLDDDSSPAKQNRDKEKSDRSSNSSQKQQIRKLAKEAEAILRQLGDDE